MGRVFRAVLTDNGAEFSDEAAIAALLGEGPGETRLFYCDPGRSDQKGACGLATPIWTIPGGTAPPP